MSTNKIIFFVLGMTILVALLLAGFKTLTQDIAARNADIFDKRQILEAVARPLEAADNPASEMSDEEVLELFQTKITSIVVNANGEQMEGINTTDIDLAQERKKPEEERYYPVYQLDLDGSNYYIFSVRGSGLWDAIWGNVALEDDLNTIAGVSFDHAGETPGLGAEIKDNNAWKAQFVGKKIYEGDKYVSIYIRKGGALPSRAEHEVDGLSGATVTADGVTKMLYEGLKAYQPFIEEAEATTGMLIQK